MTQMHNYQSASTPADGAAGAPVLLRPETAAERLSMSRATIYDLLRKGQLRSVRIGRSRRIPASALAEFVAALEAGDQGSVSRYE